MQINDDIKYQLREEILDRNAPLEQLIEDYPEVNHWQIRKLYAEVRREQALAEVEESTAFLAPTFEAPLSKKALEAIQAGWMRPIRIEMPVQGPYTLRVRASNKKTYLVISDVHAPDHDPQAMDLMYQIGRMVDPDMVIINGDLFDCASLSRYVPSAEQHIRWVDERTEAVKVVAEIRSIFPSAPIKFIPGNHDVRPVNWVNANALPLQGIMTLSQWLGIDDPALGIEVVEEGTIRLAGGNLLIKHGVKIGQHAGTSVKKEVDTHGMSVIIGHCHRRALIEVTKTAHQLIGVELGCLSKLRPHYIQPEETANWQHGFAVVTEYEDNTFDVELVRINAGRAQFRGLLFQSRV